MVLLLLLLSAVCWSSCECCNGIRSGDYPVKGVVISGRGNFLYEAETHGVHEVVFEGRRVPRTQRLAGESYLGQLLEPRLLDVTLCHSYIERRGSNSSSI